jgi:hypothetical protein
MDNLITGILGVGIFAAFVVGLAESIGAVPFAIIVAIVLAMVLVDLRSSIKEGFAEDRARKNAER